jgi:hypothetical protein
MSAIQTSPGSGIVVKTFVLRGVAVQESTVITDNRVALVSSRPKDLKLLAALVNPDSQPNEACQRQLLDSLFDFLKLAHGRKLTSFRGKTRPHNTTTEVCHRG